MRRLITVIAALILIVFASSAKPQSALSSQSRSMPDASRMQQINDLMQRYDGELGSIRSLFDKQANPTRTPGMGELTERRLGQVTEKFFRELDGMGLGMWDLQQFKEQYKTVAADGHPLFPGQGAWDDHFLGTERALMMGRAQLVQRLWMETLQDTFRANPDAAVFGEIDIGSWVKMRLGDLGFQADIDFSSVAIDPDLNRSIVERFEGKLRRHTSLDMVRADALLTAHGQATADVFIGDWGKTFAELDMLKRSKWKVIKVEKNPDGSLVQDENGQPKIRTVEKPGTQLFWEVAFRKLEAGQFAEVDFPKMDLAKEPMLSLEMLRHGIHDIEHGPYSRGQKLIKMLKYAERSYFMSKKAVAEFGFNPYAANDPLLAQAAEKIITNKNDPEKVSDLLRALAGEEITANNVDAVTNKLVARAKTAMHDNAARALAFRLNAIAKIDADATRQKAAAKLWNDLGSELGTFRNTAGDPPRIMVEAQDMAKAVMEGKLPPAELEAKANDLHRLLNEAYKLPDSVIDRLLMSDSVLKLKAYLRKMGWNEKAINDFTSKARQKFPNIANFHDKVMELNQQLEKTTAGSGLLRAADWADNAFNVYEAYINSDASDALLSASIAMGRIGAQSYFPSLRIPFALYDSFKTGSPKPLGMAVAFMYFPFAGQVYMVSGLMQRADVGMRDTEFYDALNKVLDITEFDTQGKITGFRLHNIIGKEIDSESISPPGNRQAIVDLFTNPGSTFYTSPNFRYWSSLVPRQDDRFGRYGNKLENLRRFFGLSEDVRYMTVMLENFKAKSDAMPQDQYTAQRQVALEKMEEQLTQAIWISMADMLESAIRSVNVAELETRVKKFEDELNLSDIALGKNKGLTARIKHEILQNSSLLKGENPYAVGLIYDRYIKAYERVEVLRKQIIQEVWSSCFGIDYVAAQDRPMKVLLLGGEIGAPALSGDPYKDVELAEKTLAAHYVRAENMRADLATALGRPLDPAGDKDHLKTLGQIGLEWEHLLDDCADRAAPNCEPSVRSALQQRVKLYKDYLAKLEKELAKGNEKKATADHLWQEGSKLFGQKQWTEALGKFKESLTYIHNEKRAKYVAGLEAIYAQAQKLNEAGVGLEKQKKLPDAIDRYKKSLKLWPDKLLEEHVKELEAGLATSGPTEGQEDMPLEPPAEPDQKPDQDQQDTDKTKTDTKNEPKDAPTCGYEYTDWGECNPATKKQTRTAISKKPEGCVEREKPVLEQGCTPPPTEEENRHRYLNCLCRCSSGWASHIGVWYDPEGKSVPECKSSGPCFGGAGAFGCTRRHHLAGPSDCAKSCWEGVWGKGTYDPDKADRMRKEVNKKFKKPLTVKIEASKNPADLGDVIDLTAVTAEGTGGYKWTWGGCAQDAKDQHAKVVSSRECKPCTVTVTVTDQDGDSASDSLEMNCTALTVKLTQETPKETEIPIGGTARFLAEVFADDKPASGSFTYLWEHNPDVLFGDPKNPTYETTGGSSSRNTATFKTLGSQPVWVKVLKKIDGSLATIGESEQIIIDTVSPQLEISADKTDPLIGEKVLIKVQEKPAMSDDLITFWWEIKGDANNPGPEPNVPNKRAYSFKAKTDKPVTVVVHAKSTEDGTDLGQAEVVINPKKYTITIDEPRYLGPKPRIWKCDTQLGGDCPGLVEVGNQQFAVFHDIFMKSKISPSLADARYQWSIEPKGLCGLPSSTSEIKINCSQTGTFTVYLKVLNSDGDVVGETSRSVAISVSQEDLDGAQKSKEAQEKVKEAKKMVAEGKLDEGITLVSEAAGLDPKNAEAKNLDKKWDRERTVVKEHLDNAKVHISANIFDKAEKEIALAEKLHPKYAPLVEIKKQLSTKQAEYKEKVVDSIAKAKGFLTQGKLDEAIQEAQVAVKFDPQNKEASTLASQLAKQKEQILSHLDKAKKHVEANTFEEAEKEWNLAQKIQPQYGSVLETGKFIQTKKEEYKKNITDKIEQAKKLARVGQLDEAIQEAQDAAKADPQNKEASSYAAKLVREKEQVLAQIEKTKKLMAQSEFAEADKELIVAKNLHGRYPPVMSIAEELGNKSREYEASVQKRMSEIRSAIEKKDYLQALALAQKMRQEMVLNPVTEKGLKEQEDWAKKMEAYKEEKRTIFAEASNKLKNYDYTGAVQSYERAFQDAHNYWNGSEDEYKGFQKGREEALVKKKQLDELTPIISKSATSTEQIPVNILQDHLAKADVAIALQPNNQQLKDWRKVIEEKIQKIAEDTEKKDEAQKWRTKGEAQQKEGKLIEALESYRQSLKFWPDPVLEVRITKLEDELKKQPTQSTTTPTQTGVTKTAPTDAPSTKATSSTGIAGLYEGRFNNHHGKMEFQLQGSTLSGRLWLQHHGKWETLTNISYNAHSGKLEFTRPISGATQRYSGVLSDNRLEGIFTQENSSTTYKWWAQKVQSTPTPAQTGVTATPQTKAVPTVQSQPNMSVQGTYTTNYGEMNITQVGNKITGTYTHKEGKIEGTLKGNTVSGMWHQSNGKGLFIFQFNPDYSAFTGKWSYNDAEPSSDWHGTRIASSDTAATSPANIQLPPETKNLTGSAAAGAWQGTWKSVIDGDLCTVELTQDGTKVTGTFKVMFQVPTVSGGSQTMTEKGTVNGVVSGNRLAGTLTFDGEPEPDLSCKFDMSPDTHSFSGQIIDLEDGEVTPATFTRAGAAQ